MAGLNAYTRVTVTENTVYYTSGDSIRGIDLATLEAHGIGGGAQNDLGHITTDGQYVYWTYANGLRKALAESGSDAIEVSQVPQASEFFDMLYYDLVIDSERAYWTSSAGVLSAPLGGGPPVLVTCSALDPRGIAVDDSFVYWIDDDTILQAPKPTR